MSRNINLFIGARLTRVRPNVYPMIDRLTIVLSQNSGLAPAPILLRVLSLLDFACVTEKTDFGLETA